LELVHGDLCGLVTLATTSGNNYFLLLIDYFSHFMWAYAMSSKSCVASAIRRLQTQTEAKVGRKLRVLRTDRGGD
jgi:hypothetical protein